MRYRVFAYGTLMFPEIAASVTGERTPHERARLPDHARHALRRRIHPGAVHRPGHSIDGVVYHDLTPAALTRIDDFEDPLYRRHRVTVIAGEHARECEALVYLLRPRWQALLLPHDWCPETFRRHWHARFLERCREEFLQHTPARTHAGLSRG